MWRIRVVFYKWLLRRKQIVWLIEDSFKAGYDASNWGDDLERASEEWLERLRG